MRKLGVYDRGDIIRVDLDPVAGSEQGGFRRVLVLTTAKLNQYGDTLIVPISQGGEYARARGLALPLTGSGCETQGVLLLTKFRMCDLRAPARKAAFVEKLMDEDLIDSAIEIITSFIDPD